VHIEARKEALDVRTNRSVGDTERVRNLFIRLTLGHPVDNLALQTGRGPARRRRDSSVAVRLERPVVAGSTTRRDGQGLGLVINAARAAFRHAKFAHPSPGPQGRRAS
jgi:hypothetical protein